MWLSAFMAFTAGLLSFLGVEALSEAFALQAGLPASLGGAGLVLLGVAVSFLGMTALSGRLTRGSAATGLTLALLIAIGIGLHNLGEGLAIGASFAIGELQLGAFLIVGFMIHNVTEGLGIATPVAKTRVTVLALAGLALDCRRADDPRRVGRRIHVERRPHRALLRDRRRRGVPGRGRGRDGTSRATRRAGSAPATPSSASSQVSPRCTSPVS